MTGISVRTVFPNITFFSVYSVTRSCSVSVNERLSSHIEEWIPLMFGQGVPSQHPHSEEGLQRGTASQSLPCSQPAVQGAVSGVIMDLVVWRFRVCSGWCAGWDGSQGGRNAGTLQPPASPSLPLSSRLLGQVAAGGPCWPSVSPPGLA